MPISQVVTNSIASGQTITSPTLVNPTISGTLTGTLVSANMPIGSVLQVVQGIYSTQISLSSPATGTITATGLTATITPKFSTSKILVLSSNQVWFQNGSSTVLYGHLIMYRNVSTAILTCGQADIVAGSLSEFGQRLSLSYLDSPATTSATSYSISFMNDMQSTNLVFNRNSSPATIILMEIAA
jgi:hypothetical protein